jgi:hypothetical protein
MIVPQTYLSKIVEGKSKGACRILGQTTEFVCATPSSQIDNDIISKFSMHFSTCLLQSCSGETIGLRHDHSKTGSFSVRSRFCPSKYKIYIIYRFF